MPGILRNLAMSMSRSQRCPDCDRVLSADDINIKEGVALCPSCGKLLRLSELKSSGRTNAEILDRPPSGCTLKVEGQRLVATVSIRSIIGFLFPGIFALFWNGIVSIFVLIAIAGLYANLIGPLGQWVPVPGVKDGKPEMNGGPMDLGMTLFLCIFLIPFVTVGVVMSGTALINLLGKTTVVIDEFDSYTATGVWFFRWKKRFDAKQVREIGFAPALWQTEGANHKLLEIQADRTVKCGTMVKQDRLDWLRIVLRDLYFPSGDGKRNPMFAQLSWLNPRLIDRSDA